MNSATRMHKFGLGRFAELLTETLKEFPLINFRPQAEHTACILNAKLHIMKEKEYSKPTPIVKTDFYNRVDYIYRVV